MCFKNGNISAFSGFMSPLHLLTGRTVSKIVRDQVAQAGVRRRHCTTARSKAITDGCVGLLATFVVLTEAELSLISSSSQTTLPVAIALTKLRDRVPQVTGIRPYFDVIPGRVRVMPVSAIPGRRPELGSCRVPVPLLMMIHIIQAVANPLLGTIPPKSPKIRNVGHLPANISKTVSRSIACQLELNISSTGAF